MAYGHSQIYSHGSNTLFVFGEIETWQMYVVGSIAVVGTLLTGLTLVSDKSLNTQKSKKGE